MFIPTRSEFSHFVMNVNDNPIGRKHIALVFYSGTACNNPLVMKLHCMKGTSCVISTLDRSGMVLFQGLDVAIYLEAMQV